MISMECGLHEPSDDWRQCILPVGMFPYVLRSTQPNDTSAPCPSIPPHARTLPPPWFCAKPRAHLQYSEHVVSHGTKRVRSTQKHRVGRKKRCPPVGSQLLLRATDGCTGGGDDCRRWVLRWVLGARTVAVGEVQPAVRGRVCLVDLQPTRGSRGAGGAV